MSLSLAPLRYISSPTVRHASPRLRGYMSTRLIHQFTPRMPKTKPVDRHHRSDNVAQHVRLLSFDSSLGLNIS